MKHPGEIQLALFAAGDLGLLERWRVGRHVRECGECGPEVAALRAAREAVRTLANEMPEGVNWTRLAQEMRGNVRVGLAAGECVGPAPSLRPKSLAWHAMTIVAASFLVMLGAMWLKMPRQETDHLWGSLRSIHWNRLGAPLSAALPDNVVLEASPASIILNANGGTMSFPTSPSDGVAVSVNMQGSAGAQYVDSETGQVTINRVYYAQ